MPNIRLGLFWSKGHPQEGVQQIRPLGEDESNEINDASRALHRYTDRPTFVIQSENYRSVVEAIGVATTRVPTFGPNSVGRHDPAEIRNRIALWLQASRMVLDQTEADIKRSYGRQSSELSRWTGLKERLEAKHSGFRLLRQVRNFLHSAPFPLTMQISAYETGGRSSISSALRLDETALRKDQRMDAWLDENHEVLADGLDIGPLVESMQLAVEELKLFRLRADLGKTLVMSFADSQRRRLKTEILCIHGRSHTVW